MLTELIGFVTFAFVGTVSPGPNNAVLWASGMTYGYRATLPHVLGTAAGIGALVVGVAAGLGAALEAIPGADVGLKVAGSAYLLYVAYRVVSSTGMSPSEVVRPLTFRQAVLFQWVNPKAWVFVIAAVAAFLPEELHRIAGVTVMTAAVFVIVVVSASAWAVGGAALGRLIRAERTRRVLNLALALLIVASVVLLWV